MKTTFITMFAVLVALCICAERRALRVLPAEAATLVNLERVAMDARRAANTNQAASIEVLNACTNWARVNTSRMAYEDYAVDRTGKSTNTTELVQAARLEILEVQHVE